MCENAKTCLQQTTGKHMREFRKQFELNDKGNNIYLWVKVGFD